MGGVGPGDVAQALVQATTEAGPAKANAEARLLALQRVLDEPESAKALLIATERAVARYISAPQTSDDVRIIAAETLEAFLQAILVSDIKPLSAAGYLSATARSKVIDSQRSRSRMIPVSPESMPLLGSFSVAGEEDEDDEHESRAAEDWERLTTAAQVDRDAPATAILASAWDAAVSGERVTKAGIAGASGYDRGTVQKVLEYCKTFLSEGHERWKRPHR